MDNKFKIDFIKNIMSADLSGASMSNQERAKNVRNFIFENDIDLDKSDTKIVNKIISMLGYAQILKK